MLLSAVIVNCNGERLLARCLASLAAGVEPRSSEVEVLVVDNGSTDGSAEMVRESFPGVRVLEMGRNLGFGAAVNAAVAASSGEWILTLNNDLTIDRDAVAVLMEEATGAAPDVGSIAAQMRFDDKSERINSAGIEIDQLGVAADRLLGSPARAGGSTTIEVFGVSAGAALYRRSMIEALGGFDEAFFVFLEDADLAWRARMRGWRSLYAPGAVVHHVHSATSVHNSAFKHYHVGRNRIRLIAKNAESGHLRRWGPAMLLYELAYVVYASVADRTLAPVRGRISGLRGWPDARRAHAAERRPVPLAPVSGLKGALRRRAAWADRPPRADRA